MEKIENRKQKAFDLFTQGYCCAQAVAGAFSDLVNISEDDLLNLSCSFGAGFSGTRNLCGAVSSMGLVLGLVDKIENIKPQDKQLVFAKVSSLAGEFQDKYGSLICAELLKEVAEKYKSFTLPVENKDGKFVRPCIIFVLECVDLIEKYLEK
jgi:C_GCAxxG_C_C family probable redox protein